MNSDEMKKEVETQTIALRSEVEALQVIDQQSYNYAAAIGQKADQSLRKIDETCDPVITAAHQAHKAALDQKKKLREPIEAVKTVIDAKMKVWWRAEQERIAAERRRAEEEERRRAEEEALANAQALQDVGLTDAAIATLDQPVVTEKVFVPEVQKAGNESYREIWSAEVVDFMALIKAVAAGTAPVAYLQANTVALNQAARAFKGTVKIPGIVFKNDLSIARRSV